MTTPTVTAGQTASSQRSVIRSVALPSEHGGWGLTLEPILVAAIVVPTIVTACLAVAAVLAFLARTPVKVLLVDSHRGRRLDRTRTAAAVAGAEIAVAAGLVAVSAIFADSLLWWPAIVAAPLVGTELWFDMRSRSRRLVPELCGAAGIAAIAAVAIVADGQSSSLAAAVWLVLAARAIAAIVMVRHQVRCLHSRPSQPVGVAAADLAALSFVAVAVAVEPAVLVGAAAVAIAVAAQHLVHRFAPTDRAVVLGLRQSGLGLIVALATAFGVLAS